MFSPLYLLIYSPRQDKTRQSLFPKQKTLVQGESMVKCVNDVK